MKFLLGILLLGVVGKGSAIPVVDPVEFLINYNNTATKIYHDWIAASWAAETDITHAHAAAAVKATNAKDTFDQQQAQLAQDYVLSSIPNVTNRREMAKIASLGLNLNATDLNSFNSIIKNMTTIFDEATVCKRGVSGEQCGVRSNEWVRDPDLIGFTANSTDYDLLQYIWLQWRQNTGDLMIPQYKQYVQLGNQGAQAAKFPDLGAYWRGAYDDPSFEAELEQLWRQILPLYEELHTYVRRKLMQQYPGRFRTSAIPAHILGNMWAQQWNNVYRFSAPYPNTPTVDVTDQMVKQNYTAHKMFTTAESFYTSLGLPPMTPEFWNLSMLTRPANRNISVECYASAEDFYKIRNYGIKMCAKVTMEDLVTIHHEMGHVEYFMAYHKQPVPFRNGANPGFHEAIGDTMALSVSTPAHLNKIGLLLNSDYKPNSPEQDINFLYKQALEKIAFLPFGYLIDSYRWKIFDGSIPLDQLNTGWWYLRHKYQGLVPPVPRDDSHFDAGSKFHVADNVPYIRYFVSFVIQFQFHEALCKAAGYNMSQPLHKCDIYNSTAAGARLLETLRLGYSHPWQYAMGLITNQATTKMDTGALTRYFKPLMDWLVLQNKNECYGWNVQWPAWYYKTLSPRRCGQYISSAGKPTGMSVLLSVTFFWVWRLTG